MIRPGPRVVFQVAQKAHTTLHVQYIYIYRYIPIKFPNFVIIYNVNPGLIKPGLINWGELPGNPGFWGIPPINQPGVY